MPIIRPPQKKLNSEILIAVAATITSICALVVSIYQTRLMREQQLTSVWPYIIVSNSLDNEGKFSIIVSNYGVGPAIIDSTVIVYRNNKYRNPIELLKVLSKEVGKGEYGSSWSINSLDKFSFTPSLSLNWFSFNDKLSNILLKDRINNNDIDIYIYYHSIYNQHWCYQSLNNSQILIND